MEQGRDLLLPTKRYFESLNIFAILVGMKRKRTLYDSVDNSDVSDSPNPTVKKPRILFTEEQKEALKTAYAQDPYPSTQTIEELASTLRLSTRTVVNWFHNHRMRLKQQLPRRPASAEESCSRADSSEDLSNLSAGETSYLAEYSQSNSESMQQETSQSQWLFPSFQRVESRHDGEEMLGEIKTDSDMMEFKTEPTTPSSDSGCMAGGTVQEGRSVNKRKAHTPKWVHPRINEQIVDLPNSNGENDTSPIVEEPEEETASPHMDLITEEEPLQKEEEILSTPEEAVNGEWKNKGEKWTNDQPDEIINGVCIRQTSSLYINGDCEPTAVPSMNKSVAITLENEHLQHIERLNQSIIDLVEGKPPTPPGSETHSTLSRPGSASSPDGANSVSDDRWSNVKRLQHKIEEKFEEWDEPEVKKQEQETNIQKLQQGIEQAQQEDWEF